MGFGVTESRESGNPQGSVDGEPRCLRVTRDRTDHELPNGEDLGIGRNEEILRSPRHYHHVHGPI